MSAIRKILGGGGQPRATGSGTAAAAAAATEAQLKAAFGEDAAFIAECTAGKFSMEQAWKLRAERAEKSLADAEAARVAEAEDEAEPAATAGELKAAFGADPAFALECAEQELSMTQAWKLRAERTEKALAESRASARRVGSAGASGHPGVTHAGGREAAEIVGPGAASGGGGGGRAERRVASSLPFEIGEEHPYMQEVRRVQAVDGVGYGEAVNRVNKNRPDLAEAYRADKGRASSRR